jgi:iron complex transport system substrate-binding protein
MCCARLIPASLTLLFATTLLSRGSAEAIAEQAQEPAAKTQAAAEATRVVTDELGRRVTVPVNVKRVVSLAPNLTETIYALGLEDKLVGDTSYCDSPEAAKSKPHVGSMQNPSLEAIVALRPDLVLMSPINRFQTMDTLSRLGIPVYGTEPHTVEQTLASIGHLADILGAPERGVAMTTELEKRLSVLHARLKDRPMAHVLFVVWEEPLMTIGQNTFIADALRWAGAESVILSSQEWPRIGMEDVVRLQPDWIVLSVEHGESEAAPSADFRTRPAWKELRAVELGRVVTASDEMTRPSPGLVGAIEELARELHPEAFAPPESATAPSAPSEVPR